MLKNYLEAELAASMQKNLVKKADNVEDNKLTDAVEYLNSAIDILQDLGLNSKANKVFNILEKIALKKYADDEETLVEMPSVEENIADRLIAEVEAGGESGDEGSSGPTFEEEPRISEEPIRTADVDFPKTASQHKRPKDPRKISDRHTKGLTSEKMVANLKHHGTVFNSHDISHSNDDLLNLEIDMSDIVDDDDQDLTFED